MEMMVIECFGVVRGVKTDHCAPSREACEIHILFPRSIGVPVLKCGTQSLFRHKIGRCVAHLECKGHIVHHLGKPFPSPIGVGTERTTRSVIGLQRQHAGTGETLFPFLRSREERQEAIYRIDEGKIIPLRQTHLPARGHIG